jgi:hypothetical protein
MHPVVYRILDYQYCDRQHNAFDVQSIYVLHNMVILHVSTLLHIIKNIIGNNSD